MNDPRAGELGVENPLSCATTRDKASDRTNVYRDGGFEAQDGVPVDQYHLVVAECLFDDRSHGHEKGPLSVFDRLDDDYQYSCIEICF